MTSVGYLILGYPPVYVATAGALGYTDFMQQGVFFRASGMLAVVGTMLFGVEVLRHRSFGGWICVALVVCPALLAYLLLTSGPEPILIVANLVQAAALIAMGLASGDQRAGGPEPRQRPRNPDWGGTCTQGVAYLGFKARRLTPSLRG